MDVAHPDAPPGRAGRRAEVPGGAEVAVRVDGEWQLRERAARGPEDDRAAAGDVEGRVVARADERRPWLDRGEGRHAVEGDRAAGVRADLRVGEDPARGPAAVAVGEVQLAR